MKTEMYRPGEYRAAGIWYPQEDLYGYPDTLIRARTSAAYELSSALASELLSKVNHAIDIGSCHGHGVSTIRDVLEPKTIVSTDRWYEFLYAQKNVLNGTAHYVALNLPELPFKDDTYDCAFMMHVIEHLPNPKQHLDEISRMLKPGGALLLATPNRPNLVATNPDDEHVFDQQELRTLLQQSGFQTEVFSICPDARAKDVHERKKYIARQFPISNKLRKKVPWNVWDKHVLHGQLTSDNFFLGKADDPDGIDLLALAVKPVTTS